MADTPEWLVPGAAVLAYSTGGQSQRTNSAKTTVKKVAAKSFTVEREKEPRFDLGTQSAREGGTWGWTRRVVPADSDTAREVLAAERGRRLVYAADAAFDAWQRDRSPANRAAAIAALQAVED